MPDEIGQFQIAGPSWADRARCGELNAVLSPTGSPRRNRFLHGTNQYGAQQVVRMLPARGSLLDFGCGTGRFLRYFAARGFQVQGTEITAAMIDEAARFGLPAGCRIHLTDGVHIPLPDASLDVIWACGVLRFSLVGPNPAYAAIAAEMWRVLRPGGLVCNLEMYIDSPSDTFNDGFAKAGFQTRRIDLLNLYRGWPERASQSRLLPPVCAEWGGYLCAAFRKNFFRADARPNALRDLLFVWAKPLSE